MQHKYEPLSKRLTKYFLCGMLCQCLMLTATWAWAAPGPVAWPVDLVVTGTVTSADDGGPLPGVNVVIKGTAQGTTTDLNGKYTIQVPDPNTVLVFSFIGFAPQEIDVASRTVINVSLGADVQQLEEVVVVGYGTQKKAVLTGAVVNVSGRDIRQTKNENPQNMLTGRVAGVRVWQKSAEPGSYSANFDIRGMGSPLVVIDGVQRTVQDFQRLNPNDIEDISVLKDASAAIYGIRAANGVVLVTTKKGSHDGKATINYNGSYTFQKPSSMPMLANVYQTMTLYNEQAMNDINGGTIIYDDEDFADFYNGLRTTTDWNSLIIADWAPQTQHNISITGGEEKTQYYVGMGYNFQEGFFKSGDLNYHKYNFRTNITTELAKGLSFNINLSGSADQQNNPYYSTVDIIRNYWSQGVLFPAYADPENTLLNYQGLALEANTVAMMTANVSGYRKYQQKNVLSSATLDFDFASVSNTLAGLKAKALISYDYRQNDNNIHRKEYYQYTYDEATESYIPKLYANSSPGRIRRELYTKQQVLGQFILNYDRPLKGDHNLSGMLGLEAQRRKGDNYYAQRDLAFEMDYLLGGIDEGQLSGMSVNDLYEYVYASVFGRVNYAYANRYLVEVQFRNDGSSKFAPGHQWGFFPSVSLGWRLSEESFFHDITALSFINQFKLRASYGVTANDNAANYEWATGYTYPATGSNAASGYYNSYAPGYVFDGAFAYAASPQALPNVEATWVTAHTLDIGVDFEAWNGLFGFTVDYFDRRQKGLFARASGELPTVVGATAPLENLDSDRQFGIDLALSHRNTLGQVTYKLKAIATVTRQKYLTAVENGPYGNSYDEWRNDNLNNRYQGVQFGYESAGRYLDWDDIWTYAIFKERNVLPGDYKYVDWNGDGEINSLDQHPFAFDQTPWLNFSFAADFTYRRFDFNFLLQGTAMGSMQYKEPLYAIWGTNGGGTLTQYLDRWHPVDPTADPYDPETEWVSGYYGYTGHYPAGNSEFNRVSTAFLRLKSIELGYNVQPKALSWMSLRVFANAYNMLTLTGVRFVDPEHPDDDLGRLYPLNKTYTVGVSASF